MNSIPPDAVELIPKRLYFCSLDILPQQEATIHYFSTDRDLVYEGFNADFGPLNLACVFKYCRSLQAKLSDPRYAHHPLVHVSSRDYAKRANAAFLAAAFLIVIDGKTSKEVWAKFAAFTTFVPYRDASMGPSLFGLSIGDCLAGLEYAIRLDWFNMRTFDLDSYEYNERLANGDLHWIVPGKFLAFAGPNSSNVDPDGYPSCTPEVYTERFNIWGVKNVVRLNKPLYDGRRYGHEVQVHDLYFLDGSCPSKAIIDKFFAIAEESGPIAVHCKAGLGRTGTLIGLYCMKHFRFPARAWIGWNRIVRPGSVLGPQQQFLCEMEATMFAMKPDSVDEGVQEHELSKDEAKEDVGQGDRLLKQKQRLSAASTVSTGTHSPKNSLFSRILWGPEELEQ